MISFVRASEKILERLSTKTFEGEFKHNPKPFQGWEGGAIWNVKPEKDSRFNSIEI